MAFPKKPLTYTIELNYKSITDRKKASLDFNNTLLDSLNN